MRKIKGIFAILVVLLIMMIICSCSQTTNKDINNSEKYREYGHIKSHLQQTEECYMCGETNESMMSYYRQYDSIGLIALNEWYVLDSRLVAESDSNSLVRGKSESFSYEVDAMPNRKMSQMTVSSEENFDSAVVREHLCQACLDQVTENMKVYLEKTGKESCLPFCIVDYQTLEIYPVQKTNHKYFVRDYWVETLYSENEIEIQVYYLPERNADTDK